jgi:hypothetical protein
MEYTAKLGRSMLQKHMPRRNLAMAKWLGILSPTFHFEWKALWDKTRAPDKELFLI